MLLNEGRSDVNANIEGDLSISGEGEDNTSFESGGDLSPTATGGKQKVQLLLRGATSPH